MAKKVTCPHCGKKNDKELAVEKGKRWWCPQCVLEVEKSKKYHDELYDYICELFEIDKLNAWHHKQIKDMKEKYNFSYRGIKSTLYYFHEIKGNPIIEGNGIGIVAFVYEEAKKYYVDKKRIADVAKGINPDDLNKEKTITIKKHDIEESRVSTKIKEIDIEDIDLEE